MKTQTTATVDVAKRTKELIASAIGYIEKSIGQKLASTKPFALIALYSDGIQGRATAASGQKFNFLFRGGTSAITPYSAPRLDSAAIARIAEEENLPTGLGTQWVSGLISAIHFDAGVQCGGGWIEEGKECHKGPGGASLRQQTNVWGRQERRINRQAGDITNAAADIYRNSTGGQKATFASVAATAASVVAVAGVGYYFLGPGPKRPETPERNAANAPPPSTKTPPKKPVTKQTPSEKMPSQEKVSPEAGNGTLSSEQLSAANEVSGSGQSSAIELAKALKGRVVSTEDMGKAGVKQSASLKRTASGLLNLEDELWGEAIDEKNWGDGWNANSYAALGTTPREVQPKLKKALDDSMYFGGKAPSGFSSKAFMGFMVENATPDMDFAKMEHKAAMASHLMRKMPPAQKKKILKGGGALFGYQQSLDTWAEKLKSAKTSKEAAGVLRDAEKAIFS